MKTLYKISYFTIIGALIALGLLLVVSLVPIPGNIQVKIVQSGSMEPTIKTGSLTVVKPLASYAVGDIIMFGPESKTQLPTTHRIVADEVRSGVFYYTTKGDANNGTDLQSVRESEVIGKVFFSIPYLGYLLAFAKKPLGFLLLIGVPTIIVILDEVATIRREMKSMKQAKKREEETPEDISYGKN